MGAGRAGIDIGGHVSSEKTAHSCLFEVTPAIIRGGAQRLQPKDRIAFVSRAAYLDTGAGR